MNKINTLLVVLILFGSEMSYGQFVLDWTVDYQHTTTNDFSNEARKIVSDPISGDLYVLQDVTSNLDLQGNPTGNTFHYTVLTRYNVGGNFIQQEVINVGGHSVNGFDFSSGFGLELDGSGNVFVGYTSHDAVTGYDVNISKYNNLLTLQWTNQFNPTTDDAGMHMKITPSGNVYAIAKSASGTSVRHKVLKATGAGISTVAFYTFTPLPDFVNSIAVDASENVYVTGYRLLSGVKSILYASLSPTGALRWSRVDNCGTVSGDDSGNHITIGADGMVYLTGTSVGTVQHGVDVVTLKINSASGKKIWQQFTNYNLSDGGLFLSAPDLANVFVSWVASNTVFVDLYRTSNGGLVRRIAYTPVPVSNHSSINGVSISAMEISNSKGIYLTGTVKASDGSSDFTSSYLIKDNFTTRGMPLVEYEIPVTGDPMLSRRGASICFNQSNDHVYFLEDVTETYSSHAQETIVLTGFDMQGALRIQSGLSGVKSTDSKIKTWPSPVTDELHITTNGEIALIEITDINGRLYICKSETEGNSAIVDMRDAANGNYLIKVTETSGITSVARVIR